MSYELIIEQCSPTLAGIKTGSLFSVPNEDKKEFKENIKRLNSVLVPRGLRLIPVKQLKNRVLIYLYRPNRLKRDLENSLAENILLQKNYPTDNADRCVAELIKRLKSGEDFPHEVGLFLGYPAEDVNGFIKYGAKTQSTTAYGAFTATAKPQRKNLRFIINVRAYIKRRTADTIHLISL